jgi:hypothetical protein
MLRITSGLRTAVRMNLVAVAAAGLLIAGSSGIAAAATTSPLPVAPCVVYAHGMGVPTGPGCNTSCLQYTFMPCRR